MRNGEFAGSDFGWVSPFTLLFGIGLCLGYTLLGARWLVRKCEGGIRETAWHWIPCLSGGTLVFLIIVFAYALTQHLQVMGRWLERPYLFVFTAIGTMAAVKLAASIRDRRGGASFPMVVLVFAAAFGTLAVSFWPHIIPFEIDIDQAATPGASLEFMFWGRDSSLSL